MFRYSWEDKLNLKVGQQVSAHHAFLGMRNHPLWLTTDGLPVRCVLLQVKCHLCGKHEHLYGLRPSWDKYAITCTRHRGKKRKLTVEQRRAVATKMRANWTPERRAEHAANLKRMHLHTVALRKQGLTKQQARDIAKLL